MAGVEVTITGMLYDKLNRTTQNVVLIGEATLTGLGVGGGPIIPPQQPPGGGGGGGDGIWGPPGPWPSPPIALPPGQGGPAPPGAHPMPPIFYPPGTQPHPEHPIVLPPEQIPPEQKPPETPPPGTVTPVPPPAGQAGWPVQPITQPPYVLLNYPGYGPVIVTPPPTATPA